MKSDNDNGFSFSYNAGERAEIKKIRDKYVSDSDESKLERLKRLDKAVTSKCTVLSLVMGIIGTLIFGIGMCCVLEYGSDIKVFVLGIIIGIIGIIPMALAYPVYIYSEKKARAKVAPEIIKLTDELLK